MTNGERAQAVRMAAITVAALSFVPVAGWGQTSPMSAPADANLPPPPKDTIVTACLDEPIVPGKNTLWCATFQLAWNELMAYDGGPVTMKNAPTMLAALNRSEFTKENIDAASYVAVAGRVDEGVLDKARKEVAAKFPGRSPSLLAAAEGFPPKAVMMYAMLSKHLPFEHAFTRIDGMRFHRDPNAASNDPNTPGFAAFGFGQYYPVKDFQAKQGRQVQVIHYDANARNFVVELLPKAREDRIILTMIPPKGTLGQTVVEAMRVMERPNTLTFDPPYDDKKLAVIFQLPEEKMSQYASLLPMEDLSVPIVNLDFCRDYSELLGRPVAAKNPRVNGLPVQMARQTVRFRLDEKGGTLNSEAVGGFFCGPPRSFCFNRPFLLMLLKRGASKPYFALWIGNTELFEKAK